MGFNGTNIVSLGWNFAHRQVKIKTGFMVQRGDPTKTKQKQHINHLKTYLVFEYFNAA